MKLYYSPGACSMSDHIALEWIGQSYTTQRMTKEGLKSPDYLKLNPAGAVPVLENEGWVLTQNVAILNYLADSFPEAELGGDSTPKGRAEVNRWLAFLNSDVHTAFHQCVGGRCLREGKGGVNPRRALTLVQNRPDFFAQAGGDFAFFRGGARAQCAAGDGQSLEHNR